MIQHHFSLNHYISLSATFKGLNKKKRVKVKKSCQKVFPRKQYDIRPANAKAIHQNENGNSQSGIYGNLLILLTKIP